MAYDNDQATLLKLREIVQEHAPCQYLEIGSEWGRSLLPALLDPKCFVVHSVDLRPQSTPDERGCDWTYNVSTAQMREWLATQATPEQMRKLQTFDMSTADYAAVSHLKPNLVFLDAEHTNQAAFQDFLNIQSLMPNSSIFAGHDSNLVFDAIENIAAMMTDEGRVFYLAYLSDVVFAFAFGKYIEPVKKLPAWDRAEFIRYARQTLNDEIVMNAPTRPRIPNTGVLRVPTL